MRSCPCMPDCPQGCDECTSDFCSCLYSDNDPDFIECEKILEGKYHNCLFGCAVDDFTCVTDCSREYHEGLENCPCRVSFDLQCKTTELLRVDALLVVLVRATTVEGRKLQVLDQQNLQSKLCLRS